MSYENWYQSENWYEPLKQEAPEAKTAEPPRKKARKKGLTPGRIVGLVFLIILLIVGSSLAFAGSGAKKPADTATPGETPQNPEDWAEDWNDFFDSFYEKVEMDLTQIDIPRAELPQECELALNTAEGEELSLQELYERCSPSIVAITAYENNVAGYNWGTGVIVSADGLILTNTHVINGCSKATVTLFDDREFEAKLVGADSISDVALLKIEAGGLPAAEFGESASLRVGDRVAAIGNPLGETFRSTLTDGIISAIERGINYNGHSMTLLQTNTAINEGNSGGALFNMYGQVIGVTNMKMMSAYSSIEGIGFAIPSATVKNVVDALVRDGEVRGRPSIGITVGSIPENAASHYELPKGLYVSAVTEGTDAEAKGVRVGDIITEVNGTPVSTTDEINEVKNQLQVGDSMTFTIWRDGETLQIDVMLMDTNDVYG